MRFRVWLWISSGPTGGFDFVALGAGSAAMDATLLGQLRDGMRGAALHVFLVDTTANTITRMR